jgi:hypothetical protein
MNHKSVVLLSGLALVAALAFGNSNAAVAGYAGVSPEGLKLVPNSKVDALYLRDGADFSGYDKFAMLECFVAFRTNWKHDQNEGRPFRVMDNDIVRIKAELAKQFRTVFIRELTAKGEKQVTAVGKGVLILRPSILNLDVIAPETMNSGYNNFSTSAGQATLVLELFDSVTSELLARIIDTEAAGDSSSIGSHNGQSNRADAERVLTGWADRFGTALQNARASAKAAAAPTR